MREFSELFYNSLPSIDLHVLDRDSARVIINDFVNDNLKQKNEYFVIIHGNGSGVLRNTTKDTLLKNKYVVDFKLIYNNTGSTIVRIKLDK